MHLQEKAELEGHTGVIHSVLWSAQGERLVSIEDSHLRSWQLGDTGAQVSTFARDVLTARQC